jgi:tetratricopeptide (TPR) repeat protein
MTLYGLGGCGKSALVLEFAYRVLAECLRDLVFWVPAMSRESFELAYREIAIRLRLPGVTDPNTNINKLVKETLSADRFSWLMIVDNADDPAILLGLVDGDPDSLRLGDYLPSSCRGAVLFTTRSRKAARTLTSSCVLALEDMSQSEARELLTQHMTNEVVLNDPSTAIDQLLSTLAYLPLAIVQAAAYINNNDILISDYMSLFQHAGAEIELFSEQFEDLGGYPEKDNTVARTWNISFDQIRKQDPLAAEYLSFMASISRSNIPQSLLPLHGSAVERIRALGTLTGYAFITERQTLQGVERERFFDMHRLVHVASTEWLHGSGEWASWAHTVVHRLEELVPCGGHNGKEIWAPYLAHALHVAALGSLVGEKARASLLDRVGWCQTSLGQYAAAEISHKQAISLRRQVLGHEHPDMLISMSSLALVLKKQGRYRESEILNRETLAQREKVLGQKDPVTLASLHNLALVLDRQGKYHEAEAMNRQALAHKEEVLGYEHPDTLMTLTSLAGVLDKQGRYEEAEAMHRQTLAQKRKVFGHEHPETLLSMNNLAMVLDRQGKYEEAETIHRQTLAQTEKVLGKHPDMLTSMNNLAMVLDRQGKHKEAEAIHRQTLLQRKEVLGHTHPDTLTSMHNFAIVLDKQGNHKEAEAIYRQTLTHRKEVLGDAHPDTLVTLYCLAQFLTAQRCYDESFALYERACAGYTTALGTHHPTTRACHQHYAAALALQDQAQSVVPPTKPDSGQVAQKGKGSKLLRGLAKIGIRSSKPATR